MKNSDEMKFAETMTMLGVVFPTNVTQTLANAYFVALKPFTIEQVMAAAERHIEIGRFFPKPIELADIINAGKPNGEDKAVLAWMSITSAISKIGPYRSLILDDRLAMEIVKHVGGWSNLCNLSYKELDFKKREFVESYKVAALISQKDLPKSLSGLHDTAKLENKVTK